MPVSDAVSSEFSRATRVKGEAYARGGRVQIDDGSSEMVSAAVFGTRTYRVIISRRAESDEGTVFDVSCECLFFSQGTAPCKHIWALFRVADEEGYLASTGSGDPIPGRTYVELVPPEAGFDPPPVSGRPPGAGPLPVAVVPQSPGVALLSSLERQVATRASMGTKPSRHTGEDLIYVFERPDRFVDHPLVVHVMARRRKKTGGWTQPKPAKISRRDVPHIPDPDRAILTSLMGTARADASGWAFDPYDNDSSAASFAVPEAFAPQLVHPIVATGRAFFRVPLPPAPPRRAVSPYGYYNPPVPMFDLAPVVWDAGAPWTFQLRVDQTRDGWRIDGEFVRGDDRVPLADADLLSDSLLWIRGTLALMAPVDLVVVNEMKAAAPVDVPEIERPRLSQLLARLGLPAERIPEPLRIEVVDVPPIPVVRLRRPDLSQYDAKLAGDLSFDYGGSMAPSAGGDMFFDDRRQVTVRRRPADEDAAAAQLKAAGVDVSWDAYQRRPRLALPARRFAAIATDLLAQGWRIEAEGKIYRPAHSMRLSVSSGIDWFDLQGTIRFGDDQASLVDVLAALSRGEQTIVLGDGTVGLLPEHWLRRYLPLAAAGHTTGDALRFRQAQAALLDALLDQQDATHAAIAVDATFQRVRDELSRLDELTAVDPPPSFTGVLRDYQRGGLAWLQFLARAGVGGCLADDMGLGKTVMVLALLAWRQEPSLLDPTPARPSLIVVPRSLVHNWMAEAARFAPSLRVLDFSSGKRSASPERFTGFDVILSTYGTLRQDIVHLKDIEFDYVILDEAQAIKNAATVSSKAARLLRGRHRLTLSGTPIENHLGELWSIFEFLNPGLLGQSAVFQRATSAASFDPDAIALLGRGLRPFILRRTKGQVARELPAKTEQTLLCELSPRERTFYDGLRRHYRASVLDHVKRVGLKRSQMHILEALLRLRQAACHPGLVDAAKLGSSSAKLDVLIPRLAEVIAEGHKALVFSQFTSLLAIVREQLDKDGVTYEYLDGRTRDRQTPVERFQSDPACQLFLISLKAGGVGLNLTAAEYVFLLDPWWNPAVETQAIDRTHRIGQTREVFAYRLIAAGTIEEKVLELQRTKRDLADAILSPAQSGLRHLQQEDLDVLLS